MGGWIGWLVTPLLKNNKKMKFVNIIVEMKRNTLDNYLSFLLCASANIVCGVTV